MFFQSLEIESVLILVIHLYWPLQLLSVCSMYEQSSHNVTVHGVLKMDGWGRGAENNTPKELPSTFMNELCQWIASKLDAKIKPLNL